jgi:DNA-binding HxlR family transcriptional regulator
MKEEELTMVGNEGQKRKEATCEIEVAFSVIGGKWKPMIMWFLGEFNVLRFGQFQRLIPDITHKILTKQLRELEMDQLIQRKVYPEVPMKVEYSITEKGRDVLPILSMMCEWADKYEYFGFKIKYDLCELNYQELLVPEID